MATYRRREKNMFPPSRAKKEVDICFWVSR
jgi:hypothetical protein